MASVNEVFNKLVEQKHLQVKTGDLKSHHALRIRLVKLFSRHKDLLEDIGFDDGSGILSVSAVFDGNGGVSTFHIRRRGGELKRDWEIVETEEIATRYNEEQQAVVEDATLTKVVTNCPVDPTDFYPLESKIIGNISD